MKLTKKQLSALQRIVGREQTRYDETQSEALAGVHPSEKHFAITDGTMVVLFAEQPEGIPVGDRAEYLWRSSAGRVHHRSQAQAGLGRKGSHR